MEEETYLTDVIEVEVLQQMQDTFSQMTGMASLVTDANGVAVTRGSNFTDFCMKHTRKSEIGCSRCEMCDMNGAKLAMEQKSPAIYHCHAGLVDYAAPIIMNGKMIGCFIGGQVMDEEMDEDAIREMAEELELDSDAYLEAARKLKVISEKDIQKAAGFLYNFTSILSYMAKSKYKLQQASLEIKKAADMKSDFLANMSHEIRTPMNAVIGMADMALREDLPLVARDYINQIKSSGRMLLTIINDVLDFSKIESGKMDLVLEEYMPMSMLNDITNIIMTRIGTKNVELIMDIASDIPYMLLGDSVRIKQIIVNLANNAVKFTNDGKVELHIDYEWISEDQIELLCSVSDTGIGIKKQDMQKLFATFSQVDSKRNRNVEGTGLGLAISKRLLDLMDGSISVESEYEKGSKFSFSLPQKVIDSNPAINVDIKEGIFVVGMMSNPFLRDQLKKDICELGKDYQEISSEEELFALETPVDFLFIEHALCTDEVLKYVEEHPDLTGVLLVSFRTSLFYDIPNLLVVKKPLYVLNIANILAHRDLQAGAIHEDEDADFIAPEAKVLIVDDNVINLTVAEGLLEPLQMKIDTATGSKEAIEKINVNQYDLIFMDHMMPEVDGIETTHIIRRFYPEYEKVPIIALTANAVGGVKNMFLREGMNDFVAKPIEVNTIIGMVRKWLPKEKIQKLAPGEKLKLEKGVTAENVPDIHIEGLDTKAALMLLGQEKLFWHTLEDFYKLIDKKSQYIKELEQEENWQVYTIEVHALKSSAKQIGANELSAKAATLEEAGNRRDEEKIHMMTDEMLVQYRYYKGILKPYFQKDDSAGGELQLGQDVLENFFSRMKEALEDLDMSSMEDILGEMRQYRIEDKQKEFFERLSEAVDFMDVDACEDILEEWEKCFA